jgi:thioesterase domain-containing protein
VLALVHAVTGSPLPFVALARHLGGDLSVYGLQAPGPEASRAGTSIPNLAARYVAAVDAVRGMSPLVVAGWSMGGCVALEMARLWRERGVPVARTLLLDTWVPPGALPAVADQARVRGATAQIEQLALADVDAGQHGDPEIRAELRRIEEVQARNREAFLDHRPHASDEEVDLLAATDVPAELAGRLPEAYLRPDRGWGPLLPGLRVHRVPGDHFTIVAPENAADVAAVIGDVVDEALSYGVLTFADSAGEAGGRS